MVSFHVLLLDRAGNNLVNADFSLYLGHIFAVKHIYLTLYIVDACHVAPIYSVPLYLLAALFTAFTCSLSLRPCVRARCARCLCGRVAVLAPVPAPVCAPADAWSTVDFFVRRPCPCGRAPSGPIASSRSLSVRPRGRARRARARPRALPCPCACACGRVRARVCVGAVRLPSSRLPCISFAYNGSFHSPIL